MASKTRQDTQKPAMEGEDVHKCSDIAWSWDAMGNLNEVMILFVARVGHPTEIKSQNASQCSMTGST